MQEAGDGERAACLTGRFCMSEIVFEVNMQGAAPAHQDRSFFLRSDDPTKQ
jgi:hypothetical protein